MTRGEVAIGEELASLRKLDTRKRNIGIENVKRLGDVGLGFDQCGQGLQLQQVGKSLEYSWCYPIRRVFDSSVDYATTRQHDNTKKPILQPLGDYHERASKKYRA